MSPKQFILFYTQFLYENSTDVHYYLTINFKDFRSRINPRRMMPSETKLLSGLTPVFGKAGGVSVIVGNSGSPGLAGSIGSTGSTGSSINVFVII